MSRRRLLILAKLKESGEELQKLYPPSVQMAGNSTGANLNIFNNAKNGQALVKYFLKIGDDDMELVNNGNTIYQPDNNSIAVDLTRVFIEPKSYTFSAKVTADNYADSDYTPSFSFRRYADDTYSTVGIRVSSGGGEIPTLYYTLENDYNIPTRKGSDWSYNFFIHKMTFYFEHPNLISVKSATLTYADANGNEIVDLLSVFVENGKTSTIVFDASKYALNPQSFYYSFEFVYSGSGA